MMCNVERSSQKENWINKKSNMKVQGKKFTRMTACASAGAMLQLTGSYDFSSLGLRRVTFYCLWVHGWDRACALQGVYRLYSGAEFRASSREIVLLGKSQKPLVGTCRIIYHLLKNVMACLSEEKV